MNVLLVREDGLGDALACAPLVAALLAAGHGVSAVLGTHNADAFAPNVFARVHVLDRIPWPAHGATPASRARALAEVRAAAYDVALIATEELSAYEFVRESGIAVRVGFINGASKPLKSLHVRTMLTRAVVRAASARRTRAHEVETIFALGAELVSEHAPTRDVARLRALVIGDCVKPDARDRAEAPIAMQVSQKFATAGLDRDAFVACARALRARGDDVLVLGDDDGLVREIARASDARTHGACDLGAWKWQIASARALVTGDSGAAHVAGMTGIATVDAFASNASTAYDVRRWAPWAAPYRAIVLDPARDAAATARVLVDALDDLLAA